MKISVEKLNQIIREELEDELLKEKDKKKDKKKKKACDDVAGNWAHNSKTGKFSNNTTDNCHSKYFACPEGGRSRSKAGSNKRLAISNPAKSKSVRNDRGCGCWSGLQAASISPSTVSMYTARLPAEITSPENPGALKIRLALEPIRLMAGQRPMPRSISTPGNMLMGRRTARAAAAPLLIPGLTPALELSRRRKAPIRIALPPGDRRKSNQPALTG